MKLFGLAVLGALLVCGTACDSSASSSTQAAPAREAKASHRKAPVATYRDDLLDLAYQAASRIPLDPHIKDRSKAQQQVVGASIKLGRTDRAAEYTKGIENWRRGMCLADLAFYDATHGNGDMARERLEKAAQIAQTVEDWRRDGIRARIAETQTVLEEVDKGKAYSNDSQDSKGGESDVAADTKRFDAEIEALDRKVALGDFEATRLALHAYARLFERFYANEGRRNLVEERIRSSWKPMPSVVRFHLLIALADSALTHADIGKALALVDEAQVIVEKGSWPLEHRIPMLARAAVVRHTAGDAERARAQVDAALGLFNDKKAAIVDIWRAGALRPLAEAYQGMGDTAAAIAIYKQAVAEGTTNPNSRPRAEDLAATCASMALHGVEPDAELWRLIRKTLEGLDEPW